MFWVVARLLECLNHTEGWDMPQKAKRVLIVEDNLILSMFEERVLRKMGHKVVGKATSGEKAIELFKKLKPDFVLMDISLSGEMDGFETTRKIRECLKVPVVFVSGNSDLYKKSSMDEEGFNEFVSKPFTYYELAEPIKRILPQIPPQVSA